MTALTLESVCAQLDIGWMMTRAKNTSRARLTLFIKPLLLTNCFASTFSCRDELPDTLLRRCLDGAAPTELLREPTDAALEVCGLPRGAAQLEDVHARVGAIDDEDVAAIV